LLLAQKKKWPARGTFFMPGCLLYVATGVEDGGKRSARLYGGVAAAPVLLIAALALHRKKAGTQA
jgi:hypothetical protein